MNMKQRTRYITIITIHNIVTVLLGIDYSE